MQLSEKQAQVIEEGFSSEEELKREEIVYVQTPKEKVETHAKEEVKFKIPPPQEIKSKQYSLHPDIATGWAPKIQLPLPIPIMFDSKRYDGVIKKILKKDSRKAKICYLGPRYENTFYAWYDKSFAFPYTHIKAPNNMKFTERPFCGQHWEAEEGLHFDSFFESGNLDSVVQVGPSEYDLFMRVDTNTRGHLQWFNFKVKNLQPGQDYRLNICNFQKSKTLFSRGAKPYVFSLKRSKHEGTGWQQFGENLSYDRKPCKTYKVMDHEPPSHHKLSFIVSTNYEKDELQMAYCIPYTYSTLSEYLHSKDKSLKLKNLSFLKMSKLCTSLGGLEVPLLIIHESSSQSLVLDEAHTQESCIEKKCVVVCGRAHPGESNGSFMMEGFLDFLCGDSEQAQFLRRHVIFKIVPMLNPDGVAIGNYRTGLTGRDFNREYRNPDKELFPEVFAFKKLVTENKFIFKRNLSVFLDFHGHSVKKNTFVYGPEFPIIDKFYYECRMLPKILGNITPMFRYYSCSFKVSECKVNTARAILLRKLGIPLSYTIETSNAFYFDYEKLKDVPYTDQKWLQMGSKVGVALFDYFSLVVKAQTLRIQKMKSKAVERKNIQIRRTGGSNLHNKIVAKKEVCRDSQQQRKSQSESLIVSGLEDEAVQMIFEEIRKAEAEKERDQLQQKCSDDELSEGSSDGQGQEDDISAKKMHQIYSLIKSKKMQPLEKYALKKVSKLKSFESEKQLKNHAGHLQRTKGSAAFETRMSQEILEKNASQASQKRKPQSVSLFDSRKPRSTTPKVVNFSFGRTEYGHSSKHERSSMFPSKISFFDMGSGDTSEAKRGKELIKEQKREREKRRQNDNLFRKTFGSTSVKERVKEAEFQLLEEKRSPLVTGQIFYPGNHRKSRFEARCIKKIAGNSSFLEP